ncbi:hypothetical protein AF384_24665, partial [Salmonella enterica subsp. enterica serovar Typhimurium]
HSKLISFTIREVIFGKLFQLSIHTLATHIRRIRHYLIIPLRQDPRLLNIRKKRFRRCLLLEIAILLNAK